MSDAAIIRGVFVDLRTLPSRSIARVTIEIPIEAANDALAKLGGFPLPGETRWVAVARLVPDAPTPQPVATPADAAPSEPLSKLGGRRWDDLKSSQQAGIRCNEPEFQAWLGVTTEPEAATIVRKRCGVDSRGDLDRNEDASAAWWKLNRDYALRHDAASLEQSLLNGRH